MSRHLLVLFLALLTGSLCASADPAGAREALVAGNTAYQQEDFAAALRAYREALDLHGSSAALHYNLAGAAFRGGEPGLAVLHYEKALALDPQMADARQNLAYVRAEADVPAPPRSALERFSTFAAVGVWSWTAVLAGWLVLGCLVVPRFFDGPTLWSRLGLGAGLLVGALAAAALYGTHTRATEGVALTAGVPLRIAPAPGAETVATLQAGEIARIGGTQGRFYRVRTASGERGWIAAADFAAIWDTAPQPTAPKP